MDGIVFKIDGEEYPFDSADSLTMDEAIILHDYSGLTLDQLVDIEGFNPKVIAAFMHIAVLRRKPDLKQAQIRKLVGAVKIEDLEGAFEEAEAEPGPPAPAPTGNDELGRRDEHEQPSGEGGPNGGGSSLDSSALTSTGFRG